LFIPPVNQHKEIIARFVGYLRDSPQLFCNQHITILPLFVGYIIYHAAHKQTYLNAPSAAALCHPQEVLSLLVAHLYFQILNSIQAKPCLFRKKNILQRFFQFPSL
jgi:hypothetical protein